MFTAFLLQEHHRGYYVLNQIVSYAKENGMKCGIVNCMMGGNYIRTPEKGACSDEVPALASSIDPSYSFVHGGDKGAYTQGKAWTWGDKVRILPRKGGVIQYGDLYEPSEWKKPRVDGRHPELKDELMGDFAADRRYYDNPPQASIPSTGAHFLRGAAISTIMTATSQSNRTP